MIFCQVFCCQQDLLHACVRVFCFGDYSQYLNDDSNPARQTTVHLATVYSTDHCHGLFLYANDITL